MADMINIKDLAQKCALSAPVPKTISLTLEDGETCEAQVFVRRLTFASSFELAKAFKFEQLDDGSITATDIDTAKLQAARVRSTICTDVQGTPLFATDAEVLVASNDLINALYLVADEVNNFMGKSAQTNLETANSLPS